MSVINQYNLYFNTNYRNSSTVDYPFFSLVKPISLASSNNYFEIAFNIRQYSVCLVYFKESRYNNLL